MNFLTVAALAIGLLVAAPLLAHLLRRRPPREVRFAAAHLVSNSPAVARRRAAIEDRALFSVRALAVAGLALLGATPFVSCERLSITRQSGASVAIAVVIDDSMSMKATAPGAPDETRFEHALAGARELVSDLQSGDAVAIVLAGKPPRVVLAATTSLESAEQALDEIRPTDRGTDVAGALAIASELLGGLEHIEKRIVLLSDLAYPASAEAATTAAGDVPLWVPLAKIRGPARDCGVIRADRDGPRVNVRVACAGAPSGDEKRKIELVASGEVVATTPLRLGSGAVERSLDVPESVALDETLQLYVRLSGGDALAADDIAAVVAQGGELTVAIIGDAARTVVATGGAPPVEQALKSLRAGLRLKPLATVPERSEVLDGIGVLIIDDLPGLTPEERRRVSTWVRGGGVLLLTLGPTAAAAPLGSGFEPMLPALVRWSKPTAEGVDVTSDRLFGETAAGIAAIDPRGRAELDRRGGDALEVLTTWSDGAPFALRHKMSRGVVIALTVPLSTDDSDFALRPAFLSLLSHLVDSARVLGGASRSDVGTTWTFPGIKTVSAELRARDDETERVEPNESSDVWQITTDRIGIYDLKLDASALMRVTAPLESEVALAPKLIGTATDDPALGSSSAPLDISRYIALGLLALLLFELGLRLWSTRADARAMASGPQHEAVPSDATATPPS